MAADLNIGDDLRAYCLADASIAALVGTRWYPVQAPQNKARPYVVYHLIFADRVRSLTGPSNLGHPRIQLDVIGDSYASVQQLADLIRNRIDEAVTTAHVVMGSRTVQAAKVLDAYDDFDEPTDGTERGDFRRVLDCEIWYTEEDA